MPSLERLPKGRTTDNWEGIVSKNSAGSWVLLIAEPGSRRKWSVVDTTDTEYWVEQESLAEIA